MVPSEWDEPYGLVAGEAQIARTPVIATRVGGLQELIINGTTGLLVPPRDPQALASAMQTLWTNPDLCQQMGRAGQTHIQSICSLETYIEQLLELYQHQRVAGAGRE